MSLPAVGNIGQWARRLIQPDSKSGTNTQKKKQNNDRSFHYILTNFVPAVAAIREG